MPTTPIYGFSFEDADDQPGHSLTGGSAGIEPILAEQVENELQRVEGDISDLQDDVAQLQFGWNPIASGQDTGASIGLDLTGGGEFPAGTFSTIRLRASGRVSIDGEFLAVQLNGDTGNNYRRRATVYNMTSSPGSDWVGTATDEATSWLIAEWDTLSRGTLEFTMMQCDRNVAVPFYSTGVRINGNGFKTEAGGRFLNPIVPVSMTIFLGTGTIDEFVWEVEGYRP